jgi:DNA-binding transcriptional ArsR family regulator
LSNLSSSLPAEAASRRRGRKSGNLEIASGLMPLAMTNEHSISGEFDLLPEEVDWRDGGCEVYPACLNCPLPKCIEEEPRGRQRLKTVLRARRMKALRRKGKSIREIARLLGVSQRTVQRQIKNKKAKIKGKI